MNLERGKRDKEGAERVDRDKTGARDQPRLRGQLFRSLREVAKRGERHACE